MLRVDEDCKNIYMNDFGSIVMIVTKSNLIRVVDFLGKSLVFTIKEFKDGQKTSKLMLLKYCSSSLRDIERLAIFMCCFPN